mgnify:CR=1 FL=1
MKKFILGLCLLALLAGCDNSKKQNELNKEEQIKEQTAAENAPMTVSELPFNLQFGMGKVQVDSIVSALVQNKTISTPYDDDTYKYVCKLKSGKSIETRLNFGYHNDSLYVVSFGLDYFGQKMDEALFNEIDTDISGKLGTSYKRTSYYDGEKDNKKMIFTMWFKGNQYVFLRKAAFNDISIINAPIYRKIKNAETEELLSRPSNGNAKVENSAWDGSVSQVKKYLKNTLKDPGSYKSIEWGNVVETKDGYMVRHKYKAKNSFAGYAVENIVFYLDFNGNVTKTVPY